MKALVIYDTTGRIWSVIYGETEAPQGVPGMFVDVPEGAVLDRIDVTDPQNPKAVYEYLPGAEKPPETLDEWKEHKKQEVSAACEQSIYKGVTVTLTDGTAERFALTEHDQINLVCKQAQLSAGAQQLEYHADGKPCRYYSAEDMQKIITAAMWHVSYHTTYCNALNMWIAGCETAEDVQAIFYGADVPDTYQSEVLKAYLEEIAGMADAGEESTDAEAKTADT